MKSAWKVAVAALLLISSIALAQDAPVQPVASPASDTTASDKTTNAASNSQAGPEYVIGPDDVLHVAVWKEADLTATVPVRPDGKISLPLLDDVLASGMTPKQLADSMKEKLRKYIADPRVTMVVTADQQQADLFGRRGAAFRRLKEYGLHTHYLLSACEVAFSACRNKERKSRPYVKHAFLKLDSQSYLLNHMVLRIPTKPRHFIFLIMEGSRYHLSFIDNPSLMRGSITLTPQNLSIAFSKEIALAETAQDIGVDVNERNVTASDTSGNVVRYDTSEIAESQGAVQGHQVKDRRASPRG